MAANDVDTTVGRAFNRRRQFERRMREAGHGERRRSHGNERVHIDRAVVVVVFK